MLNIHSSKIDIELSLARGFKCAAIDHAAVNATKINNNNPEIQGCTLPPEYAIAVQPAEDIVIPIFVCTPHYNSFKIGLVEGVGISENLLS